jgi:hypothetical protein
MRTGLALLGVLGCIVCGGAAQGQAAGEAVVHGVVTFDGDPVGGVTVEVSNALDVHRTISDQTGRCLVMACR